MVLAVEELRAIDGEQEIKTVTWIREGHDKLHNLLTMLGLDGSTWTAEPLRDEIQHIIYTFLNVGPKHVEVSVTDEDLERVTYDNTKRGITVLELKRTLEGIIEENTKPLDVLSININKEDCEMVKLNNGKPLWERESTLLSKLGFTLTTESGRTYVAEVPEYLRMPLAQTYLGVISLAGAAIAIQKLAKYPENAIVDSVRFDLPGTEMDGVSLLPDWFYIGVHHPVMVRELMWFLDGYLRMFTPNAVSTAELEQETKIKDALDKLLEDWR